MRGDNASRQNQDSAGDDLQSQFRGGSDEDDLTPAQSRRKAQNRAAYVTSKTSSSSPLYLGVL